MLVSPPSFLLYLSHFFLSKAFSPLVLEAGWVVVPGPWSSTSTRSLVAVVWAVSEKPLGSGFWEFLCRRLCFALFFWRRMRKWVLQACQGGGEWAGDWALWEGGSSPPPLLTELAESMSQERRSFQECTSWLQHRSWQRLQPRWRLDGFSIGSNAFLEPSSSNQ